MRKAERASPEERRRSASTRVCSYELGIPRPTLVNSNKVLHLHDRMRCLVLAFESRWSVVSYLCLPPTQIVRTWSFDVSARNFAQPAKKIDQVLILVGTHFYPASAITAFASKKNPPRARPVAPGTRLKLQCLVALNAELALI